MSDISCMPSRKPTQDEKRESLRSDISYMIQDLQRTANRLAELNKQCKDANLPCISDNDEFAKGLYTLSDKLTEYSKTLRPAWSRMKEMEMPDVMKKVLGDMKPENKSTKEPVKVTALRFIVKRSA